jgi:hypothetical protein
VAVLLLWVIATYTGVLYNTCCVITIIRVFCSRIDRYSKQRKTHSVVWTSSYAKWFRSINVFICPRCTQVCCWHWNITPYIKSIQLECLCYKLYKISLNTYKSIENEKSVECVSWTDFCSFIQQIGKKNSGKIYKMKLTRESKSPLKPETNWPTVMVNRM